MRKSTIKNPSMREVPTSLRQSKDLPRPMPQAVADLRAKQVLTEMQDKLKPEDAMKIVAINLYNREYVVGDDYEQAYQAFHQRWPGESSYMIRADGGPVFKFHRLL